ncbi:hypothetical protein GCM10008967_04640 [Bacillus carboniphilus]|uniref:Transposase IS200-like domain-containing protein n=1 Tax=Bacillus carboniphilus TaxID=86663 RepID=A0ABN0VU66_9BACI
MPRKPRRKSTTGIYHIMLRGINKQIIFEDDEDRYRFLWTVKKYKSVCEYEVYSYCLMDNHVHLLIKEASEPLSTAIQRISSSYVHWYNGKYERTGHLFQERYRSEGIETRDSFMRVLRYIHQNPMKAGLVKSVFEHQWTSMYEYIREGDLVEKDRVFQLFSHNSREAMKKFKSYMEMEEERQGQFLGDSVPVLLPDSEVIQFLAKLGVSDVSKLQQMKAEERNSILGRLKNIEGISIRQLARVTGISKSVIGRVGQRDRFSVPDKLN